MVRPVLAPSPEAADRDAAAERLVLAPGGRPMVPRTLLLAAFAATALLAAVPAASAGTVRSVEAESLAGPLLPVQDAGASGGSAVSVPLGARPRTHPTDLIATTGLRVRLGGCHGRVRIGSSTRRLRTVALRGRWRVVLVPSDPGADAPGLRTARAGGSDACRRVLLDRVDVVAAPIPLAAAVRADRWRTDADYRRAYRATFDGLTPEDALKMEVARPRQDGYAFADADGLLRTDGAVRRLARGHPLVYDRQLPTWLREPVLPWSRSALLDVLRDHIATTMTRYAGRIDRWDVVNEAVDADGRLKSTFWRRWVGDDYLDWAFRFARAVDPTTRLVYNDDGIERPGPLQDGVVRLLQGLLARRVPVDGVGVQAHVDPRHPPGTAGLDAAFARFAALGLGVEITEADVPLGGPATSDRVAVQTAVWRRLAAACWRNAACDRMTVWGVADNASWRGVAASATLLDAGYRPKPALDVTRRALSGEF